MKKILVFFVLMVLLLLPVSSLSQGLSTWGINNSPTSGTQATISKAANTSFRHVATCVSFSAAATTAPTATQLNINLRDGASGAGTVLHTWVVAAPATVGTHLLFSQCGFNLAGSVNTAMTVEFSAGLANEFEAVSLSGYDSQ